MKNTRVGRSLFIIYAVVFMSMSASAWSQAYPDRTVRLIVPYATGGGSDILARQIGASLQQRWGKAVVVDNKTGAGGNIGSLEVARSTGDGYTLLLQNSSLVTNMALLGKLPYDHEKDLTPIMLLGATPMALVAHPSAHISTLKELITASKARPNTLTYASCGAGTLQHFVMEVIKQQASVDATHAAYKGCAPAVTDVVGGQVPLAMLTANLVVPYVQSGRLKVIGVTTAEKYPLLPNAATFTEQGLDPFDYSIWYALMGPANMPQAVVSKIVSDVDQILSEPSVKTVLSNAGIESYRGSAKDLSKLIAVEIKRYSDLAKSAGIRPE